MAQHWRGDTPVPLSEKEDCFAHPPSCLSATTASEPASSASCLPDGRGASASVPKSSRPQAVALHEEWPLAVRFSFECSLWLILSGTEAGTPLPPGTHVRTLEILQSARKALENRGAKTGRVNEAPATFRKGDKSVPPPMAAPLFYGILGKSKRSASSPAVR